MTSKESNRSQSSNFSKKASIVTRNLDFNLYRAYKIINEEKTGERFNPHERLHGEHNHMRFPFGLTEKRFRWQTSANLGEKQELVGNLARRSSMENVKDTSGANWESFMLKTGDVNNKIKLSRNRAASYKFDQNRNSVRTVQPDSMTNDHNPQRKESTLNKSTANGSIVNLINMTPEAEQKYKKFSKNMTMGHEIFVPAKFNPKSEKGRLSVKKENVTTGDYAGAKIKYENDDGDNNIR